MVSASHFYFKTLFLQKNVKMNWRVVLLTFVVGLNFSCSSDDTNENGETVSLSKTIKKYSEKVYYNQQIDYQFTANFNYSEGKLVSISDAQDVLEFHYNSNKISQIKKYSNNQLVSTNYLNYEGSLLNSIVNDSNDEKKILTYNNGTLSLVKNQHLENSNWITDSEKQYTFLTNNIQQIITVNYSFSSSYKSTFEYDAKNNPMKMMNPYLKFILQYETCDFISSNNILKRYSYSDVNDSTGTLSYEYEITYDVDNYPVLIKKYSEFST